MIKSYFILELKKLLAAKWLFGCLAILLVLAGYGFYARNAAINKIQLATKISADYQRETTATYLKLLDSVETKGKIPENYAVDPRNPVSYRKLPKFAFLKVLPFNVMATGQSDLFSEEVLLSSPTKDPLLAPQDMSNSLMLKLGQLDPAAVLIFMLPLLIIAACYNILSGESENGTLKMIMVQSQSFKAWLISKTLAIGCTFFCMVWILYMVFSMVFSGNPFSDLYGLMIFSLLLLGYVFFWLMLSVAINLLNRPSATNALALLCSWIALTFLLPAAINLLATSLFEVPSRTSYISAYRQAVDEVAHQPESSALDKYFFDHPELAPKDTAKTKFSVNDFYKHTVLHYDMIAKKMLPAYRSYVEQTKKSNRVAAVLGLVRAPVLAQQGLSYLAGTSRMDYMNFQEQGYHHRLAHLSYIKEAVLRDRELSNKELESVPKFHYRALSNYLIAFAYAIVLGIYCTIIGAVIKRQMRRFTVVRD